MKEKEYIEWTGYSGRSKKAKEEGRYGNTRETFFDAPLCERRNVLTEEEREYIKNIIAPFRNKVAGIRKLKQPISRNRPGRPPKNNFEYVLQILYNRRYVSINGGIWGYDAIWLPPFPNTSKAFENLEPNNIYSLSFLCL